MMYGRARRRPTSTVVLTACVGLAIIGLGPTSLLTVLALVGLPAYAIVNARRRRIASARDHPLRRVVAPQPRPTPRPWETIPPPAAVVLRRLGQADHPASGGR